LPEFKVRPVLLDFRVEADWLKCAAPQTGYSVGQPIFFLSHDPRTIPLQAAYLPVTGVAKRRAQGRNSQSEQNGRRLADVNLHKKVLCFK
jgi:hypothetical protein